MSAIFPRTAVAPVRAPSPPRVDRELMDTARQKVKTLLLSTDAYAHLPPDKAQALAKGMVDIATYLTAPDGMHLSRAQVAPAVRALAGEDDSKPLPATDQPDFGAALKTGVEQAGVLMNAVNFP